MTWALVVAAKGGKRSRAAADIADALRARGVRLGGFVQRMAEPAPGTKEISLVRLRDGRERLLARTTPAAAPSPTVSPAALQPAAADEASACLIGFDPAGFAEARAWVNEDAATMDLLLLDAIGKLELSGEGHRDAVRRALSSGKPVALAIRDDQLVYAMEAFGLDEPLAAYTDGDGDAARDAFVAALAGAARS